MAKSDLKLQAQALRRQGFSVGAITDLLHVSKSSVSLWCKDIQLTQAQIDNLLRNKTNGGNKGRLKGVETLKSRKYNQIESLRKEGIREFNSLNQRELLVAGLGIYWGEGFKSVDYGRFGISNSDPKLIRFMIRWFTEALNIPKDDLVFRIQINEVCRYNIDKIENFWYKLTGATKIQFRKTTYIQTTNKKSYTNSDEYMGTLIIRVQRSSYYHRKVLGLIEGLYSQAM